MLDGRFFSFFIYDRINKSFQFEIVIYGDYKDMFYPNFPKANNNDTIGICAPSAGVGHKLESFDASLDSFRELGLKIKETESVRVDGLRPSSGEQRGKEFNSLVSDPDVKMIISASGGEYCIETLPYIDADLFKGNPKWVVGASDPTNILYYLTTVLDISTIYGINAGSLDWRPHHIFQSNALSILQGNIVSQNSFEEYDSSGTFGAMSDVRLDTPVYWELYNTKNYSAISESAPDVTPSEDELDVTGRIIGGCSDIIFNLVGTPYDGTALFLDKYAGDGIIWYFDAFVANPNQLHASLLKMKYAGFFRNTKAVIFGRIMFPGDFPKEDYIELISMDLDCPFIFNADIGHVKPCMTIINGSIAHLKCSNGKGSLSMSLE